MRIGCPKEIKPQEGRVGLTPAGVDALVRSGHEVYIEHNAGFESGFTDAEYEAVGGKILAAPAEVYAISDMIIKVKEPLAPEYDLLREGQTLFTYLHLAPDPGQTHALLQKKVTAIAYETVQNPDGSLPLLAPMSEVAGRLSVQIGAHLLESHCGGRGVLLGGVPGVEKANVVIIGGGNVGLNAARAAAGFGANVIVLDLVEEGQDDLCQQNGIDQIKNRCGNGDHRADTNIADDKAEQADGQNQCGILDTVAGNFREEVCRSL